MEEILVSLFGGGIWDWQDLAKTNYDWDEIFEKARYRWGFDITTNCLYETILEMALQDLNDLIEDYILKANTTEERAIAKQLEKINIEDDFNIYCNGCLDTHCNYIGDEKIGEIIKEIFATEIDEIEDKIGFTYINFDN